MEWPPSPWRILRALIATWHRKMCPDEFPEELLSALIDRLAEADPRYRLPPMTRAHTRHYMPVRAARGDRPVLLFDAFARVSPDDELIAAWPEVSLDHRERRLLATLVDRTGYLGRAESWIEGRLLESYDGPFDCVPASSTEQLGGSPTTPVRLLGLWAPADYAGWRDRSVAGLGLDARRLTKAQQRTLATLPPRLLDALRTETGDLRDAGWNLPPGGRMIPYDRSAPSGPGRARVLRQERRPRRVTTARLALAGRPLPRIEDAVRIGELVRIALISRADRVGGPDGVPTEISGHGGDEAGNHQHAFYLPEDADGDGFIDHILIHAPGGLSRQAVLAIDALPRLWTDDGSEWHVVFEGAWEAAHESGSRYGQTAETWLSITPYLRPWYAKRTFGTAEQIRRECRERAVPEPEVVQRLESIRVRERERRAVHFHRFRSKRGLRQPDTHGSILRITFPEAISGPLAFGFGCHFGLGMFIPSIQ